jgi:hypothetical protein
VLNFCAFVIFLGTKGRNKGEFTNLQGVAASTSGKILIADSNNQCVQVQLLSPTFNGYIDKAGAVTYFPG